MKINESKYIHTNEWTQSYFRREPEVLSFYSYHPRNEKDYARRVSEIEENKRAGKERLVEIIRSHSAVDFPTPEMKENLSRLLREDSFVVIGGHQACLLTGPLSTIYKAITIIQLAKREEKRLEKPVIPIFWIAGEDHDWEEVNHIYIQNASKRPQKVRFPKRYFKTPISTIPCDPDDVHPWLDELSRMLPDSCYKKEWVSLLKSFTSEKITWTRFFLRVMTFLFGKYGLLLIDSHDPQLRELESPFFTRLAKKNVQIQSAIHETMEQMSLNYTVPIKNRPYFAHLFYGSQERSPIFFNGSLWTSKDKEWSSLDMVNEMYDSPDFFSNNVITRPLMQEYLFSSLAVVLGPGEIHYWGLLEQLFKICNLKMPILFPRVQMTLCPSFVDKRLAAFHVSIEELMLHYEEIRANWLKKQHPCDSDSVFEETIQQINSMHQGLLERIKKDLNVNLGEWGQRHGHKLSSHVHLLKRHTENVLNKRQEVGLHHLEELYSTLCPYNKLQERTYNIVQYWNMYGLDWLDEVMKYSTLSCGEQAYTVYV